MDQPKPTRAWYDRILDLLPHEPATQQELLQFLRGIQDKLLDADELAMIERILLLSKLKANDIMVPRTQMVTVNSNTPLLEIVDTAVESGHSRLPVIQENHEEVIGVLLVKDLLRSYREELRDDFNLKELCREVIIIPESKPLSVLLADFQRKHNHMAIVVDEYGVIAGLITIEDVIEQIVGEIEDEHDLDDDDNIKAHSDDTFVIKATTPLEDFNEYFECQIESDDSDTIAGVIIKEFGYLPKVDESITVNQFKFTVLNADNRRIHLLKMAKV